MAAKATVAPKSETDGVGVDGKIAELDAAKNVIGFLKGFPDKGAQERILNLSGDILECWTKRVRRTKEEVAADKAANGAAATPPVPAAA